MKTLHWKTKHFNDLSTKDFHNIAALRAAVFVVEQNCPYQDIDGIDPFAFHVIGVDDSNNTLATARIYNQSSIDEKVHIGRVCCDSTVRKTGMGKELMRQAIEFSKNKFQNQIIHISAQTYLEKFYSNLGFKPTGKSYLEDGIPHLEMFLGDLNK